MKAENLIASKYNKSGFMYTEYPHKSFWDYGFGEKSYKEGIRSLFSKGNNEAALLYLHIPYCEQLCWFCTCHMVITHNYEKVKKNVEYLVKEIELFERFCNENNLRPAFEEIHFGGGSPTFLKEEDFTQLLNAVSRIVNLKDITEMAIEIDPRRVDKQRMKFYAENGINRISFGIQDFDPEVQNAVNRIQPVELVEDLLAPEVRKLFKSVNFDIICGLPKQTPKTMRKTMEELSRISPDRVCLNYLHYAPHNKPAQKLMKEEDLPKFSERKRLFNIALKTLTNNGYIRTGYDHFARPNDDVAKALESKAIHWNSLGYTPGRVRSLIGFGIHSYSRITDKYYAQNVYEITK